MSAVLKTDLNSQKSFLATVRMIGVHRPAKGHHWLYEQWKADFIRSFPDATPSEYAKAMKVIADAAGV